MKVIACVLCLLLAGCVFAPAEKSEWYRELDRDMPRPAKDVRFDVIPMNWDDAGLLVSC